MATKAEIQAQLTSAISQLRAVTKTHEDFKVRVATVADQYAVANDWCDEVDRALAEMGLTRPEPPLYKVTVPVTVTFYARTHSIDDVPDNIDSIVCAEVRIHDHYLDGLEILDDLAHEDACDFGLATYEAVQA